MSGIEVAGLVLGCLPLIIQGIESYNEGLDPIKSFVRWERELPQFIRKLRNQHVHYAQTIRLLFEPITSEQELAEMMSNPGSSDLWKGTIMTRKLQERLQESFDAYQGTIVDIERITKKIASKLDLERATDLSRNDLEALLAANPKKSNDKYEVGKRIRFGMNKKAIKALLEELDDCNKELERFTEKSEKIETYRKSVKPAFATRLQRIQSYAKSLHGSLLWSCACKSDHKTSLQLDPRGSLFVSGMKKTSATSFTVSFTTATSDKVRGSWQAAEILVEEEDWDGIPVPSPKPKLSKKSVSFGQSPPPYSVTDPGADLSLSSASKSLEEVKDLCASLKQIHTSRLGFLLTNQSKLRGAYAIDATETYVPTEEVLSLQELLDSPPIFNGRRAKLSKKERYSLALTLASSVLYLNSTPWLTDQWAAKDIFFHRTTNSTRPVDIEHPHVAPPALLELAKGLPNGQKPRGFHNKNTVLLALAISLLELYFGLSAEKYQEDEMGAADPALHQNPWLLCSMAHTWAEECQEDLSAAFLSAVRHCLRCFSDPGASLQDADFLQAAVEGIVLPLKEELDQFLGLGTTK